MLKKIFWLSLGLMTSPILAQSADQAQGRSGTWQTAPQGDTAAPSDSTEGREFDEGQVQVPREGQVENIPGGHVEAINPAGVQMPAQETQPDLFRFESRLFHPIPSDR